MECIANERIMVRIVRTTNIVCVAPRKIRKSMDHGEVGENVREIVVKITPFELAPENALKIDPIVGKLTGKWS